MFPRVNAEEGIGSSTRQLLAGAFRRWVAERLPLYSLCLRAIFLEQLTPSTFDACTFGISGGNIARGTKNDKNDDGVCKTVRPIFPHPVHFVRVVSPGTRFISPFIQFDMHNDVDVERGSQRKVKFLSRLPLTSICGGHAFNFFRDKGFSGPRFVDHGQGGFYDVLNS